VLQRLTTMNLVEQRAGSGTYVRYGEFADRIDIADVTSPLELIDVRLGIELQIVRLAVTNATVVDIEHITRALDQLEQCDHDPERFTQADSEFHLALAESTHNPLLVWLYQLLNEVRSHAQWRAMKDQILTPERINRYNRQHRRLLAVIISRDADGAAKTIQQHLEQARRDLRGVIG
jgi:DNA-binding FadR family transcriptional regulator